MTQQLGFVVCFYIILSHFLEGHHLHQHEAGHNLHCVSPTTQATPNAATVFHSSLIIPSTLSLHWFLTSSHHLYPNYSERCILPSENATSHSVKGQATKPQAFVGQGGQCANTAEECVGGQPQSQDLCSETCGCSQATEWTRTPMRNSPVCKCCPKPKKFIPQFLQQRPGAEVFSLCRFYAIKNTLP